MNTDEYLNNLNTYLSNCSDQELMELYEQILQMIEEQGTKEQPLRRFIDETPNGLITVPFCVYGEISVRWYEIQQHMYVKN